MAHSSVSHRTRSGGKVQRLKSGPNNGKFKSKKNGGKLSRKTRRTKATKKRSSTKKSIRKASPRTLTARVSTSLSVLEKRMATLISAIRGVQRQRRQALLKRKKSQAKAEALSQQSMQLSQASTPMSSDISSDISSDLSRDTVTSREGSYTSSSSSSSGASEHHSSSGLAGSKSKLHRSLMSARHSGLVNLTAFNAQTLQSTNIARAGSLNLNSATPPIQSASVKLPVQSISMKSPTPACDSRSTSATTSSATLKSINELLDSVTLPKAASAPSKGNSSPVAFVVDKSKSAHMSRGSTEGGSKTRNVKSAEVEISGGAKAVKHTISISNTSGNALLTKQNNQITQRSLSTDSSLTQF